MNTMTQLKQILQQAVDSCPKKQASFFKTGEGHYSAHDQFMGITTPTLRKIAKDFTHITIDELQLLIESSFNDERLLALFILTSHYQSAKDNESKHFFDFFMANLKHVNNWNLVDSSSHLILGHYLHNKEDKNILTTLAASNEMWERRVSIVATWYFIKQSELEWTFKIAEILLNDSHDLIHKAVGWMLREAGKKNITQLTEFLEKHKNNMPRTMLRYAIEKFPEEQRKGYLIKR